MGKIYRILKPTIMSPGEFPICPICERRMSLKLTPYYRCVNPKCNKLFKCIGSEREPSSTRYEIIIEEV